MFKILISVSTLTAALLINSSFAGDYNKGKDLTKDKDIVKDEPRDNGYDKSDRLHIRLDDHRSRLDLKIKDSKIKGSMRTWGMNPERSVLLKEKDGVWEGFVGSVDLAIAQDTQISPNLSNFYVESDLSGKTLEFRIHEGLNGIEIVGVNIDLLVKRESDKIEVVSSHTRSTFYRDQFSNNFERGEFIITRYNRGDQLRYKHDILVSGDSDYYPSRLLDSNPRLFLAIYVMSLMQFDAY